MVEAGDDDLVLQVELPDHIQHLFLNAKILEDAGLHLDVGGDGQIPDELAVLPERGDAVHTVLSGVDVGRIQLAQLLQRHLLDAALAIGGAVHQLVVDDDGHAVLRQLHVQLNAVRASFHRLAERQHGVFGVLAAVTAVGKILGHFDSSSKLSWCRTVP